MTFDAIVVGGGLAGMLSALELAPRRVALVSLGALGEGTSSAWAQGGVAAAVGDDDSPALHAADTVAAGAGLALERVVARLANDAPRAIERLARLGVRFDRDDAARYALGREGAHSRRRILRSGGDATGAELVRAIDVAVRQRPHITLFEGVRARDVVLDRAAAVAGLVVTTPAGASEVLRAPVVVLATGGLGGLYRFTTNPIASRGAGIAIAARAGARLVDLEFVQFHPTALDVPSDPLPLVTEALRGEGAELVDAAGRRLTTVSGASLELQARDVVARRLFALRRAGVAAFLDARHVARNGFERRFPTVFAACERFGIDPRVVPIPVVPAAHYHMGGIAIDLAGRTNVVGLYACGEVSATGVHGANRLASNSLLESVVYPERIARDVAGAASRRLRHAGTPLHSFDEGRDEPEAWSVLREVMYANVGVERDEAGLADGMDRLRTLAAAAGGADLRDAATVGALVAHAALLRRETRGSHVRLDFPNPSESERHRSFSTLADVVPATRIA